MKSRHAVIITLVEDPTNVFIEYWSWAKRLLLNTVNNEIKNNTCIKFAILSYKTFRQVLDGFAKSPQQ